MGSGRQLATTLLLWITLAGAAVGGGAVTVSGNQFLRDGQPWIAEGVTLVGLVSPEKQLRGKKNYATARADFGIAMLDEVRRLAPTSCASR